MPTFIDESGDTGLVTRGGKPYFRLAAVWVPTLDHAEGFREDVRQFRRNSGLRADLEFKFSETHTRPEWRHAFFTLALARDFLFTVCSIDKTDDYWRMAGSAEMHWVCAISLAVNLRPTYHRAEKERGSPLREPIVVDDNSDGRFLESVKRAFRGLKSEVEPGSTLVGKVKFHKSAPDEMVHLADMVCGSVGAYLDGDDSQWYKLISARDLGICRLP